MKFIRLEAVRGFASLYVCAAHLLSGQYVTGIPDIALRFGQEAVIVFFVLSGFVIQWTTRRQSSDEHFGQYFWKRFCRIYSVWVPAVVLLCAIASLEKGSFASQPIGRLAGNFLMLQDFSSGKPAVICDPVYNDAPLWSLHYEWWFYMLFPCLLLVRGDASKTHLVGCLAVLGAVVYCLAPNPVCRLLMYFAIWWIGAAAAGCLRTKGSVSLRDLVVPLAYVALSSVPVLVLCAIRICGGQKFASVFPFLEARHLLSAVALVLLAFGWRRCGWWGFSWTMGWCTILAPISYSLYIIHYRSLAHASYLGFLHNRALELLLYVAITLAFCWSTELLFYPWLRRRTSKPRVPQPAPALAT